jgi:hypothetical protein
VHRRGAGKEAQAHLGNVSFRESFRIVGL